MENKKGFCVDLLLSFYYLFCYNRVAFCEKGICVLARAKCLLGLKNVAAVAGTQFQKPSYKMNNLKTITSLAICMPNQPYFEFLAQPVS